MKQLMSNFGKLVTNYTIGIGHERMQSLHLPFNVRNPKVFFPSGNVRNLRTRLKHKPHFDSTSLYPRTFTANHVRNLYTKQNNPFNVELANGRPTIREHKVFNKKADKNYFVKYLSSIR